MNKKIIPAEASFFVPVEKVLFDHSKMRRSLETAAAENYPALTEDILWDYTLFTFEKKKWALISITDRRTYGEECIRHSSRPNNEFVLYSYGEPVAMSADGNASYFGTDILGSVRNVTDKYGVVQSSYDYDAFGSPYLGNLDNGMSFGYTGKAYDAGTGLYDYGFRDYSPNNARFTTVDPIRDGSNWFSYVVNDPVNYVDYLGLEGNAIKKVIDTFVNADGNIIQKAKTTYNELIDGGTRIENGYNVLQSSPLLEAATECKDVISTTMIALGIAFQNPTLVLLGAGVSLIPTGKVVNNTDSYVAASTEHATVYGDVYLAPHSTTYTSGLDNIIGAGETTGVSVKMFPGSNVTVNSNSDIDISLGTQIVNFIGNIVKASEKHSAEKKGTKPTFTVEPYGTYKNEKLLSEDGIPEVNGFSNEVKEFAKNNPYMKETNMMISGVKNK